MIIYATCALHNFILTEQTTDEDAAMRDLFEEELKTYGNDLYTHLQAVNAVSLLSLSDSWRDSIADRIWNEYASY